MSLPLKKQSELLEKSFLKNRIGQAVYTAAVSIANEPTGITNHKERVQLSNAVIMNWEYVSGAFLRLVLTQLSEEEPSDEEINIAVSSVWDVIAKAMFPGSE